MFEKLKINFTDDENLNKKIYKTIIICGICLIILIILNVLKNIIFKTQQEDSVYLNLIEIKGYEFDKPFSINDHEYNVTVNDEKVEVICNVKNYISGCNELIDLTNKDIYIHKVILEEDGKEQLYNIIIKKIIEEEEDIELKIIDVEGNPKEWTNKDVFIKLKTKSTNQVKSFSFDGGNTWSKSNEVRVSENKTLKIILKDKLGNISDTKKLEITKIDKEKPKATIVKEGIGTKQITIKVSPEDSLSGVDTISFDGTNYSDQNTFVVTKAGTHSIVIKDKAGNFSDTIKVTVSNDEFLKENIETTRKITGHFNSNTSTNSSQKDISCTTKENACNITAPSITREGYQVIGWSLNKNSKTAEYKIGQTISINKDQIYYAITKKTITVKFEKNSADSIGFFNKTCDIYNSEIGCKITAPSITKNGSIAVGFNVNKNGTTANIKAGETFTTDKSTTYYAITKKIFTATFKNVGLDYLESSTLSCSAYNGATSCKIILPMFNKKGYFNSFWSTSSKVSSNLFGTKWDLAYFNQVGHTYTLTKNITFYPNFNHINYDQTGYNFYKYRTINASYYEFVGKSLFEFENGIPQHAINEFMNSMKQAYKAMPWLFMSGKVFVMTESTYNKYSIAYGLTHQMYLGYGGDSHYTVDIQYDTSGAVVKNAIDVNAALHELAHAWDSYYCFKNGGKELNQQADFNIFYNSISNKLYVYEDGEKISKAETFAGMVTNYYWHILGKDTSKEYYALKYGQILNSSEKQKLKNFIEKYKNLT